MDVWALGVVLVSVLNGGQNPWLTSEKSMTQALTAIADKSKVSVATEYVLSRSEHLESGLKEVIRYCLTPLIDKRPTAAQLLRHPYFARFENSASGPVGCCSEYVPSPVLRSLSPATLPAQSTDLTLSDMFSIWMEKNNGRSLEEIFAAELGLGSSVLTLPDFACGDCDYPGPPSSTNPSKIFSIDIQSLINKTRSASEDTQKSSIQQQQASKREERVLDSMPKSFFVLLGDQYRKLAYEEARDTSHGIEREKRRVALFRVLLSRYASTTGTTSAQIIRDEVIRQAESGIPAALRGDIWCVILGVGSDSECQALYAQHVDKSTNADTERQISMDIVRCHQYHPLLASPDGQAALQRVLRAWLHANPNLTYWQGIDSVLAPFLTAGRFCEARAFCCLNRFVDANIRDFYRKENTWYLQDALVTLSQLITYYDPELSLHLNKLSFNSNLYAVPWLLTAFSRKLTFTPAFHTTYIYNCSLSLSLSLSLSFLLYRHNDAGQGVCVVGQASFASVAPPVLCC